MADKKQRNRKAIAIGVVGLASIMGVASTMFVIGTSLGAKKPPHAETQSDVAQKIDWAQIAIASITLDGVSAHFKSGLLIIKGDAPSAAIRKNAFETGRRAVLMDLARTKSSEVTAFANDITVNGQKIEELPDALSTLGELPMASACQTAFNTLLDGRVINFNSGSAIIAEDSKTLLDGLSDVAIRCVTHTVEVGGHTDSQGDEFANQALSERRAQAVADYLVGKGVNAANLVVIGYGETAPLDRRENEEANSKNRRIELKVAQKA